MVLYPSLVSGLLGAILALIILLGLLSVILDLLQGHP